MRLSNLALALLKANRYEECLAIVSKIDMNDEYIDYPYITSARASAYLGRYQEAVNTLKKGCNHKEKEACDLYTFASVAVDPAEFWKADQASHLKEWMPYNRIDSSIALLYAPNPLPMGIIVSGFAIHSWFNEIYRLYDEGSGNGAYPPSALPNGRIGFILVDGVPFFAADVTADEEEAVTDQSLTHFLRSIPSPTRGGPVTQQNKLLITNLEGKQRLVIVVHTTWQEELIRLQPGDWREIS